MESKLTGASVLLFEKDCILLFRERNSDNYQNELCYTEPGGKFENKHYNIEEAAEDELYEETCCLFECSNISNKKHNNHFDVIYAKNKFSRVYMLEIPYLKHLITDYKSNHSILQKGRADKHYLETNDVTRVYISDLIRSVLSSKRLDNVHVKDAYNRKIKLKKRTASVLYILFSEVEKENIKKSSQCKRVN